MNVHFTVDVEQDCPPYLTGWRGIEQGMPRLLTMLAEEGVRGTFFTTGEVARRFPAAVEAIVSAGHELGCHGDTHRDFSTLTLAEAEHEVRHASLSLRPFGSVTSFRAPYLRFPRDYMAVLAQFDYTLDSSEGRHKQLGASVHSDHGVLRVPASVTSSTLRWPAVVRDRLLARLSDPIVLFVHPWEFVDLRRERLRYDCRFRTGDEAIDAARSALQFLAARGATFAPMSRRVA
ncbi:MAG TPA: polysaccharide deacetylase family protein [Vicinamibacterales bacterium]|jgi:peptidoglycan/xylan/chitin deacetylase (PgdA/CDA1 family)